ncbi:MAG: hypothetical protein GQE15_38105 [Archangiaceae bacterium]|nr:hypothetical protein [Archangiaceae bacterium]
MRAMIFVALALTGCSKWPAIESSKRLPTDPRLGFVLVETGPQVPTFVEASAANGRLMVGVFTGAGVDPDLQPTTPALRFLEVESKTGAATPLPSAPLTPTDDFDFGVTLTERTILFSSAKTGEAAYFDGTAWFALPTLPVDARSTRFMIARSATEIVVRGSNLYRLVGSAWQLVPIGARLVLGPWGNTGLRVITQPGTLCTSLLDVSTGTLTTPVCQFTNAGTIQFDAVNGTVDDFQLITSPGYVWHFQAGTWHAGEILPIDRPRATPAGAELIVDVTPKTQADAFQSPVATLMALRGGAKSRVLLPASSAAITCACDRSDDSACECVRRPLVNGLTVFGDGSAAVLFGVSDADARRQIFVRRFDLPGDTGFDRATCSTPCPTAKACHFVSLTDTACIWDLSQSSTGPLSDDPAVTLTTVTPRDGMAVTLSVTLLDGGAADVTMATPLPNLTLLGKAHVGYRLSLSGPDLVTKHVEVTMPDTQRTAELGAIPLVRGIRLGDVLWPLSSNQSHTVVSRGGGMAVPVTSGNGARWWWLQGLADGGVTTQDLLAAPSSPRRARIDPNGRFLLLPTDVGLALLEVQTLRVVDTLAGTDWDTNFVTFANAADVFAIRRGGPSSTASAEPAGITELIAFSANGFTRRFQVTTPGTVLEVAGLGGSVLRLEAGHAERRRSPRLRARRQRAHGAK